MMVIKAKGGQAEFGSGIILCADDHAITFSVCLSSNLGKIHVFLSNSL